MLKSAEEPLGASYFIVEVEEGFHVVFGSPKNYESVAYFVSYDLADEYAVWKNDTIVYDEDTIDGYEYEEEPEDITDLVDEFTKNSWE